MIISHGAQLLLTTTTRIITRYFISVPSMLIFSMRPFSFFPIFFPPIFLIFIFHLPHPVLPSSSSPCLSLAHRHHLVFSVTLSSSSPRLLPLHLFFTPSSSPHFLPHPSSSSPRLLHRVFFFTASSSSPCLPPVRGSEHLDLLTFLRFSDPNILAHGIKVFFISPCTRCNLKNIRAVQGGTAQIMNGPRTLE